MTPGYYNSLKKNLGIFGYSGSDLQDFSNKIEDQELSIVYKKLVSSDDNRYITNIKISDRERLDTGWIMFSGFFKEFVKEFNITYRNFYDNLYVVGKQNRKLFKGCEEYYKESKFITKEILEEVSAESLPKKELFLVLSVNLNDFFLCSTKNSWTSCLDLASGNYWSSLSGYFLDKNRSMIYISDLQEKEYLGVTSYKMFNRSWCLLDSDNNLNANISYPTLGKVNDSLLSEIFGFKVKRLEEDFNSKYEIKPIYNDNLVFPFGYQDSTKFVLKENKLCIKGSSISSCCSIGKDFFGKKEIFEHDNAYIGSLKIKNIKTISDGFKFTCNCGNKKYSNIFINGRMMCKDCFSLSKLTCSVCEKDYKKKFITTDNEIICEHCKSKENYTKCLKCNKYFISTGEEVCEDCSSTSELHRCNFCCKYFSKDETYNIKSATYLPVKSKTFIPIYKNGIICDNCYEKMCNEKNIIFCEDCGNMYEDNEEKTCNICKARY